MSTSNSELDPWRISALEFPGHSAPVEQRLRFLIGYAILAPSSHNTQPWLFRVEESTVEVLADRTRALPVVDPHDRSLTMSCGSALFNLRAAIRHFGYKAECRLLPQADAPDLLARIIMGDRHPPTHEENTVFGAIARRHTNRHAFEKREVDPTVLHTMETAAGAEGAWFHVVKGRSARHAVADLVGEGDRMQFADRRFRRELASWVHSNRDHSRDGMPGYAHGFGDLVSLAEPFLIRTFDVGKSAAARDKDLTEHSPVLAVIGTGGDTPLDWLHAGLAVEHVLLLATAAGLSSSFLNQPIEVETLRPRLMSVLDRRGVPQLLVRLGYGPETKPTPRRMVREVVRV